MAFERKTAAATTTATASATTSKKAGKESNALIWINFSVTVTTKKGDKRMTAGIPADAIFKKLFGESFLEIIGALDDTQLESIANAITFKDTSINIVTPAEEASFEDLF